MTTRPRLEVIEDSVEPLLEELLAEVVTGTRSEFKANEGESITAALTDAAMATFSRAVSQASTVERALLVEALAPALAAALAPALARALAPEIVTALGHLAGDADAAAAEAIAEEESETAGEEPESAFDEAVTYDESAYDESPAFAGEAEPDEGDAGMGGSVGNGKQTHE